MTTIIRPEMDVTTFGNLPIGAVYLRAVPNSPFFIKVQSLVGNPSSIGFLMLGQQATTNPDEKLPKIGFESSFTASDPVLHLKGNLQLDIAAEPAHIASGPVYFNAGQLIQNSAQTGIPTGGLAAQFFFDPVGFTYQQVPKGPFFIYYKWSLKLIPAGSADPSALSPASAILLLEADMPFPT